MLQSRYEELVDLIIAHNEAYYVHHAPLISDHEYDMLFAELKQIEDDHPEWIVPESPTQKLVGHYSKIDAFEQVAHPYPLLSLQNTYDAGDLEEWHTRCETILAKETDYQKKETDADSGQIVFGIEPKFDGISIELVYQDRVFVQAITRGNGAVGDDVTHNVRTIHNLPHTLSDDAPVWELRVRGEIMMPKSAWTSLNTTRESQWLPVFANTRNAASGSMKMLDSAQVAERGLVCFVFDIISGFHTNKPHEVLWSWWLPVFDRYQTMSSLTDIIALCHDESVRDFFLSQDIDFDGLVIKVLDETYRDVLGRTDHHPRRAVAYKFPAAQEATQIEKIEYSVGRTWIISPVAHITPVSLSWVTISRVSLHNFDIIAHKDIKLHDRVWVQRSGEVIPYVVWVIPQRRTWSEVDIAIPDVCPVCGTPLVMIDDKPYCPNALCPAQVRWRLEHRCSKQCLDIDGIGESVIDVLVSEGMVESIPDLYMLDTPETIMRLHKLDGFGHKKIVNMLWGLQKSMQAPLWRKINGLWLPQIGKKMAKSLADDFQRYEKSDDMIDYLRDTERLVSVYGMWTKVSEAVTTWIQTPSHREMLQQLIWQWVVFEKEEETISVEDSPFAGQVFGVTWSFPLSRDAIIAHLEWRGMVFVSTPSKKTDYMIVGQKPWSKASKAEALWVTLVSWWDAVKETFGLEDAPEQVQWGLF